ncbi:MAG: hypothetical protein HY898_02910 [Deltaproteobacteria bacterium]|nr:hypothetical protein [Deltaproteobacteria bacterium]
MRTSFRGVRQLLWGLLPLSLVPVGCALSACSSSDPPAEPVDSGGEDLDSGVPDSDATVCDVGVYYGPMPCISDEQCESTGQGTWCDKSHTFSGPCGEVSWPICKGTPEGGKDGEAGGPDAGEDGEAGTPEAGED